MTERFVYRCGQFTVDWTIVGKAPTGPIKSDYLQESFLQKFLEESFSLLRVSFTRGRHFRIQSSDVLEWFDCLRETGHSEIQGKYLAIHVASAKVHQKLPISNV